MKGSEPFMRIFFSLCRTFLKETNLLLDLHFAFSAIFFSFHLSRSAIHRKYFFNKSLLRAAFARGLATSSMIHQKKTHTKKNESKCIAFHNEIFQFLRRDGYISNLHNFVRFYEFTSSNSSNGSDMIHHKTIRNF